MVSERLYLLDYCMFLGLGEGASGEEIADNDQKKLFLLTKVP